MANLIVDLVLANAKAYMNEELVDCNLAVNNGKIYKIGKEANMPKADKKYDLKSLLVLPGLIDIHVHLRDEGKAYKEDFTSGTAAAAAGGMTTVFDMPNNEPVTMSAETLRNRMKKAEKKVLVNVGFYSEFPKKIREIVDIVKEGPIAFKLFMAEQVGGLDIEKDDAILEAFKVVSKSKASVAVHAEDRATLKRVEEELKQAGRNNIEAFLNAHSEDVEFQAVKRILNIVNQINVRTHFCHVSTENGLKAIVDAKKSGLPVTCESTPHHLLLSTDDFRRAGTLALTMPPLRQKRHVIALWRAIRNGRIDVIASDHAPHALEEKTRESIWDVKVGIPNLEIMLPLFLTEVRRRRLSIGDVVRLMAESPARLLKLKGKGFLKEGNEADLTVVDLKRKYKIEASNFHSKGKYSPFDQRIVEGKPVKTFVNGRLTAEEGEIVEKAGSGRIIRRRKT